MGQATTSTGKPWEINNTATGAGNVVNTLSTSGKYVDRNIKVTTTIPAAAASNTGSTSLTMTSGDGSATLTSDDIALSNTGGDDKYVITATGSGSVSASATGKANITKAGWIGTGDIAGGSASDSKSSKTATVNRFVNKANFSYTNGNSGAAGTFSFSGIKTQDTVTDHKIDCAVRADAEFFPKLSEGYTKGGDLSKVTLSMDVTSPRTKYIPDATFSNTATSGTSYRDISSSAPVLTSGDYLYINEGYANAQKISLAKLVPDGTNVVDKDPLVYKTKTVYDNDGNLCAGAMDDAVISVGTDSGSESSEGLSFEYGCTVDKGGYIEEGTVKSNWKTIGPATVSANSPTISSVSYNSSSKKYEGSATTSVSVGNAGYIGSVSGTKNTGTAKVSLSPASIGDISVTGPTYNSNTGKYDISASQTNAAGYYGGGNKSNSISINAGSVSRSTSGTGTLAYGETVTVGAGYIPSGATFTAPQQSDGTKATVTSGSASISSLSYTYDSTNKRYNITGSATIGAPTVNTAGYISNSAGTKNTNTASVSATVSATNMSRSLVADTTTPSGYSVYRVTASSGYNSGNKSTDITIYQGEWS